MNIWNYIEIELIPFIALGIILYISTIEFKSVRNIRQYRLLVVLVMLVLAVDTFNWYEVSDPMAVSETVTWISNIVYFLLSEVIAYFWFGYVFCQIFPNMPDGRRKRWMALGLIPLALICVIILTSPWTGFIFSIDPVDHSYTRGVLHILQAVIGFLYIALAAVLAFTESGRKTLSEERRECRFLGFIALLPLVGGVLQIINYYFLFLWSFTAAAAFLMFIDFQSHRISVDALTSLNNRGNLEQYLHSRARDHRLSGWLMMIDVDRFKSINDLYGHAEGDRALKTVAQTLRRVFGIPGAFLSRYGGDEFVVILPVDDPEAAVQKCKDDIRELAREQRLPYEIMLSIGYASCENADEADVDAIFNAADAMMYARKKIAEQRQ